MAVPNENLENPNVNVKAFWQTSGMRGHSAYVTMHKEDWNRLLAQSKDGVDPEGLLSIYAGSGKKKRPQVRIALDKFQKKFQEQWKESLHEGATDVGLTAFVTMCKNARRLSMEHDFDYTREAFTTEVDPSRDLAARVASLEIEVRDLKSEINRLQMRDVNRNS